MLLPADPAHPDFRAAPSCLQLADICLTHADDPARSRRFLTLVRVGHIKLVLAEADGRSLHTALVLGIVADQVQIVPTPSPRLLRHLHPNFWTGTLAGQTESVFRDRDRAPARVRDLRTAAYVGLLRLRAAATLPAHLQRALARLGVPLREPADNQRMAPAGPV